MKNEIDYKQKYLEERHRTELLLFKLNNGYRNEVKDIFADIESYSYGKDVVTKSIIEIVKRNG